MWLELHNVVKVLYNVTRVLYNTVSVVQCAIGVLQHDKNTAQCSRSVID